MTGRPAMSIVPLDNVSSPATNRKSVDFPQPDGPTKTTNSPFQFLDHIPNYMCFTKCFINRI